MGRNDFFALDLDSPVELKRGPSLASQAYKRLKMQFLLGEMQPGRRFTYREIAQHLGISVTPAREAIFKLVAERVFESGATGTFVVPQLRAEACRELWRIRILLEAPCAELAAKNIDPRTIEALENAHQSMIEAKHKKKLRAALKYNFMFHFMLYQKADAPILLSLIQDIWARSASYVEFFHSKHVEGRGETSAPGPHVHATIISALKAGDAGRVKNGIERDLVEIRDGILLLLDSDQAHKNRTPMNAVSSSASLDQTESRTQHRKSRA
jgi:DNA-binding GntR family transcriptional regulator